MVLDSRPEAENATGLLRTAALEHLAAMIGEETFSPPAGHQHRLLDHIRATDREVVLAELADAEIVYSADLGAFVLHAIYRNAGGPALIFENKIIDQLSLTFCEDE